MFKFTFINVTVRVDVFSLTLRYTILEVALIGSSNRRGKFSETVALILVEFTIIDIALCSRELSSWGAFSFLESAFVDGAIGESHLAWALLSSSIVGALEARSINVLLDPCAMWDALFPAALVSNTALLDKFTLAMLFALNELTFKNIASR